MRAAHFLLSVLLLSLANACATSPRITEASLAHAKIEALNLVLEERFRAGDLLGVANFYADDAVLIRPKSRIEGREAIDTHFSGITDPVDWHFEIFKIGGSKDLVYQLGRSFQVRHVDEVEHTLVVDNMLLWAKDSRGTWKITVDAAW